MKKQVDFMKKKTIDAFNDASIKVPFIIPEITKNDKSTVSNALNSRLLTDGPKLHKFESIFAKFTGSKFAVGVSNGTAALHLSLKALGIGKGSEVIIPDLTFVATANSVLSTGAKPVFVDINLDTLCIDSEEIEESVTNSTRIILPVHFAGMPSDLKRIQKICHKSNLTLIEDAAHAAGASYDGKKIGSHGKFVCFSFHPVKAITTGEGGMITTNNKEIYDSLLKLRTHGIHKNVNFFINKEMAFDNNKNANVWYYEMTELGLNYRITDIQAALGESQLRKIDQFIDTLDVKTPSKEKFLELTHIFNHS